MRYKFLAIIGSIILIIAVVMNLDLLGGADLSAPSGDASLYGPYSIIRVVDGDTFIADLSGERTRIRMIGIDTAESVPENPERITKEGLIASDYTKSLLNGAEVLLEFDKERYDRFGRTLAYVYIPSDDGYVFINELLLREGMADLMTIEPNTKYRELFEKAYREE